MRLSEFQGDPIREVFKQCVGEHDELYLFGSRVDNHAKGSDIDLFLQTSLSQDAAFRAKLKMQGLLQR